MTILLFGPAVVTAEVVTARASGTGQGSARIQIEPVIGAISYALYRSSDAAFSDEVLLTATPGIRPDWYFDIDVYSASYWYRATVTTAGGTSAKGAAVRVNVTQDQPSHPTKALRINRSDV